MTLRDVEKLTRPEDRTALLLVRIADPRFANRLDLAGCTVEVEGRVRLGSVGDASLELDDFYVRR